MNLQPVHNLKTAIGLYLLSLVISLAIIAGISLVHKNTIVFFIDAKAPDSMQVYFPRNSVYSEEFSEIKTFDGDYTHGIEFFLPERNLSYVRVDPANHPVEILIKKIELRYFFYSKVLLPNEIMERITPAEGIQSIDVVPEGLSIKTTGNDPKFRLSIRNDLNQYDEKKPLIITFWLSVVIFIAMLVLSINSIKQLPNVITLIAIPAVISLIISWAFYPGFMTFDTFHALDGARNEVTDSTWPPMVSYTWRLIDLISYNPVVMHFSQVLLLLLSIFCIAKYLTKNTLYALLALLCYLCIPAVIGTLAAIWKDVLMTSFLLAGFASTLAMKNSKQRLPFIGLCIIATSMIFLGVSARHNAITAAIPLIFYLAWNIASKETNKRNSTIISTLCLGAVLTTGIYSAKTQLDKYSLPELNELKGATALIRITRAMDLAGASICLDRNLFAEQSPKLTLTEIKKHYDPRHSNLSLEFIDKVTFDNSLDDLWFRTATSHPLCFTYNKYHLTRQLTGMQSGGQFIIIAPEVENNAYGYSLPKSTMREDLVKYILNQSSVDLLKPWFVYLLSLIIYTVLAVTRRLTLELSVIFLSATLYLGGLVVFGNAADARLLFYTTTLLLLGGLIGLIHLFNRHKKTHSKT